METPLSNFSHKFTNLSIPIAGEVKKKGRTENLLKWDKLSFYAVVDCKIFTCLENKK